MIPKLIKGRGIKGVALYVLFDKRAQPDGKPGPEPVPRPPAGTVFEEIAFDRAQTSERVGFTATRNLSTDDPHEAWRLMCQTAILQDDLRAKAGVRAGGRKTENQVGHLSLSWHPDENPDQAEMERAADSALKAMGWDHLEAMIVEHTDEAHKHVHIIVCMIDPETGRTAPNRQNDFARVLQPWAYEFEKAQGRIRCADRAETVEARAAGEKGGRYANTTHRKDWAHQKEVERANALAERLSAYDAARASPLEQLQKAERDALYEKAKAQAKQLTQDVREVFKPAWAQLYRDQKRATEELKRALGSETRTDDLARFLNRNQDTLLKAFKSADEAKKHWPEVVSGRETQRFLEAGQIAERKALSDRNNAARQDAHKAFWGQYGAAIEVMRTKQADERAAAQRIADERAKQQAKPAPTPQTLEQVSRGARAEVLREVDARAATERTAQATAREAQQITEAATKAVELGKQEAARRVAEARAAEKAAAIKPKPPNVLPTPANLNLFKPPPTPIPQPAPQPTPHPSFVPSPAYDLRQRVIFHPGTAAQELKPARPEELPQQAADRRAQIDRRFIDAEKRQRTPSHAEADAHAAERVRAEQAAAKARAAQEQQQPKISDKVAQAYDEMARRRLHRKPGFDRER